jgi:hypothetical protein
VTEIPEHLLKRSRERRQAIGGGDASGGDAPAAGASPAGAPAATPAVPARPATPATPVAPAPPPPPKPDPPYIVADKRRSRIPIWAMPVLGLLPLWLFIYAKAMQPPVEHLVGPLAAGATVYNSCASCHGQSGEGGVGYPLYQGEVLKTFPKLQDQITFIYTGNLPYGGIGYGDPHRPGGQRIGGVQGAPGAMPAWGLGAGGTLTDLQLLEVVCHERITLSGDDATTDNNVSWCTTDGENYQKVATGGLEAAGVAKGPSAG